ncbi:YhgE/Pip domain-containing protein [Streptomyces sp. NPDC005548]|uniref:YhgE/Pip domain-containing protein n=1 Tax=Streptomyces sp. NPDC005548 TaxID=3364724 RepID=UPI0036CCCE3F
MVVGRAGVHFRVLRARPLRIASGITTGVLAILLGIFYVGINIDPAGHTRHLPVSLVTSDKGASVGGKQVNLGVQIPVSIKASTASGAEIDWKMVNEKEVKEEFGKGKLFGALVVPADFTSSVTALTGSSVTGKLVCPQLTVLTNQSAVSDRAPAQDRPPAPRIGSKRPWGPARSRTARRVHHRRRRRPSGLRQQCVVWRGYFFGGMVGIPRNGNFRAPKASDGTAGQWGFTGVRRS